MSDVHGAAPAAGSDKDQVAEAPEDGLTPEERTQFADMQRETSAPPAPDAPVVDVPADDAAAAAATGAAADDDDEGDEPAAGVAAAAAGADGADGRKPRRVSYSKYDRETKELKAERDAANAKLAEKDQMQARLDERLRIINEALTTPPAGAEDQAKKTPPLPKAEDDLEPDMEADIFAWNQWNRRETLRLQQEVRDGKQQTVQDQQSQQQERETNTAYMDDAESYATNEPNFVPAYQFLMASRMAELAVHYFGKDLSVEGQKLTRPEYNKISHTIVNEEKQIVQGALKAGRSPAAQLFAIAKSRGFRPPAAAAAPAKTNGAAANGAAKPAGDAAAAPGALGTESKPSVVDEIARMRNGQDAAFSLSGGGGAPPAAIDAAKLANMPQDEFEEMMENMSPAQIKKLMGG